MSDMDEDMELGGWAVVHVGGELIQDGFESQEAATSWVIANADMLEDSADHYEITWVEGDDDDEEDEDDEEDDWESSWEPDEDDEEDEWESEDEDDVSWY